MAVGCACGWAQPKRSCSSAVGGAGVAAQQACQMKPDASGRGSGARALALCDRLTLSLSPCAAPAEVWRHPTSVGGGGGPSRVHSGGYSIVIRVASAREAGAACRGKGRAAALCSLDLSDSPRATLQKKKRLKRKIGWWQGSSEERARSSVKPLFFSRAAS